MTRAKGPSYKVSYRRRREGKTNYVKRLALVKSGKPRMVVRRSNTGLVIQFIEFDPKGDRTLLTVNSAHLAKHKWPAKRNKWTAYLMGFLAGKLAAKKGIKEFVFDMGMYIPSKGSILFAALKGAADSGLKADFREEKVPNMEVPDQYKKAFDEVKSKMSG
ncbi:50S ribosomal protein L18 [Candidatus Micrarchaeota archaeon]|nr:50S ribosomal protein L18 [Candidatus Micrarchaeota archaeon]